MCVRSHQEVTLSQRLIRNRISRGGRSFSTSASPSTAAASNPSLSSASFTLLGCPFLAAPTHFLTSSQDSPHLVQQSITSSIHPLPTTQQLHNYTCYGAVPVTSHHAPSQSTAPSPLHHHFNKSPAPCPDTPHLPPATFENIWDERSLEKQ